MKEPTRGLAAAFQPQSLARPVSALAVGGALNLAFAPVAWWPIGVLAPAALFALIRGVPPRRACGRSKPGAISSARDLIRATNDGITAAVGPHGEILERLPQFAEGVLRVEVQPMRGLTPYARAGNYPMVLGATALLGLGIWRRRRA